VWSDFALVAGFLFDQDFDMIIAEYYFHIIK
jgi:hypothetical protein